MQAFGKDTFIRDSYNWGSTKRGVLSSLLHACHPLPTDTSENLKKLAKQAEISDERLVEAAMFAPQWIELTEKAIGWKGLTSAAYFLPVHIFYFPFQITGFCISLRNSFSSKWVQSSIACSSLS